MYLWCLHCEVQYMQLFLGYNHSEFNSNLQLPKNEIANTSHYQEKKKSGGLFQGNNVMIDSGHWNCHAIDFAANGGWSAPILWDLFSILISLRLGYSCAIVDYLRQILFNHSKIIYVSATMSVIDNHGTLFTV